MSGGDPQEKAEVRVIASPGSWIEGEAVAQLERTATMPGMIAAIGMPDLHPGKGSPIGAAYLVRDRIYPHLVDNDIGCGMALWATDVEDRGRPRERERWGERARALAEPWEGDVDGALAAAGVTPGLAAPSLGSVGGGNHFAEAQVIEGIDDEAAAGALGLDRGRIYVLVHSGSRGLGESILRDHVARFAGAGVDAASDEALGYLRRHDEACAWARVNRRIVGERLAAALGGSIADAPLLDVTHNGVERVEHRGCACWLHRKGAAPSTRGPVVIPGSRGALSYLVEPCGDVAGAGYSLAHGAGRRWQRGSARERLRDRYRPEALTRTALGGLVICDDRDLLYEEAPEAYKDIDAVVGDLVAAGLVRVIARLRPVLTFKTAQRAGEREGRGRGERRRGRERRR